MNFPHFIDDTSHDLVGYSDCAFHKECFYRWEHRKRYLDIWFEWCRNGTFRISKDGVVSSQNAFIRLRPLWGHFGRDESGRARSGLVVFAMIYARFCYPELCVPARDILPFYENLGHLKPGSRFSFYSPNISSDVTISIEKSDGIRMNIKDRWESSWEMSHDVAKEVMQCVRILIERIRISSPALRKQIGWVE
ncbi:MAG: hypothetical protein N3A38_13070 [Planctomycetota bacterium]|nr:hypothetical protein [Planctomycetota bacterium]